MRVLLAAAGALIATVPASAGIVTSHLDSDTDMLAAIQNMAAEAVMTWTGTPPSNSRLAFQIRIAHVPAVPAEGATWGTVRSLYR